MSQSEPIYGATGEKVADDFPHEVVKLARMIASDEQIASVGTDVTVTVREGDGAPEVYVDERGNEGMWVDDTASPPAMRMKGEGSTVSKRAQDLAITVLGYEGHVVSQYEDDTCSETTITPTA